ncbi:hypothetical protein [Microbacterium sp.]|uniref:DUF7882 family protein n=1 Tax=Microbacterium sp. TaxID=51671 RepID=UPI0028120E2D|nr:hypothetical protein [Microbacterium sp.]
MGQLFYGPTEQAIEVDDALLAHVQLVAITKLRRGESFVMSWKRSGGPGRETVWVQPSIPLRFLCESEENLPMDGRLLEELAQAASSLRGMDLSADVAPALTAMQGGARRAA